MIGKYSNTVLFKLENKKIYGFDSFEGLKEDWVGTSVPKGTFNLNKKIERLNISNSAAVVFHYINSLKKKK